MLAKRWVAARNRFESFYSRWEQRTCCQAETGCRECMFDLAGAYVWGNTLDGIHDEMQRNGQNGLTGFLAILSILGDAK